MEELHTDSIDGGHEGQLWARSRARERAYSNNNSHHYEHFFANVRLYSYYIIIIVRLMFVTEP
jgi:hypothetical protein